MLKLFWAPLILNLTFRRKKNNLFSFQNTEHNYHLDGGTHDSSSQTRANQFGTNKGAYINEISMLMLHGSG